MPTDRQQRCKKCSSRFTRPQGTRRIYCYECRPEASKVIPLRTDQPVDDQDDGPLTVLVKKELEEAGQLETWQGESAVALARLIDSGKHGASGAAGTIRALREAMGVALADFASDADVIDLIFGESG